MVVEEEKMYIKMVLSKIDVLFSGYKGFNLFCND